MSPVVVTDSHALWIRLPFEQLGRHLPVIGLKPVPSWKGWQNKPLPAQVAGYREAVLSLLPRAFGRLGEWFAPMAALQIRRICGRPKAMVYTFPVHRVYPRWFPRTPSFYYASDDYSQDYGFDPDRVLSWERQLVRQVGHVFAVSTALADLLAARHQVSREKFTIVPNGLPQAQIPERMPECPSPAPAPVPAHFRPLIGVLGGINKRLRLDWVLQAVEALPWSHWAFVGPLGEMDAAGQAAVSALQAHPRCCFTGGQPYERLFEFAASFDAAVIPMNEQGINPTCSPVRFFTQLPYGQPILVTPGCRQMQELQSVVKITASPAELIQQLKALKATAFRDGLSERRWHLATKLTWEKRAETIFQNISN